MRNSLNGVNILITAGPTWVPVDRVRIITSIFGGRTGCLIAQEASAWGADVTLLLGPGRADSVGDNGSINLVRFRYFEELAALVEREATTRKYDVMIHSAAVADYTPVRPFHGKIRSQKKDLSIKLEPTPKIVDEIRRYDPSIFLVTFKLEVNCEKSKLIEAGYRSMIRSGADLVVVNDLNALPEATIVDLERKTISVKSRKDLATALLDLIGKRLKKEGAG